MPDPTLYSLNWDLDSILPNPQTPAFATHLELFKADLTKLADASDLLPAVTANGASQVWGPFIDQLSSILARQEDLNAFLG